MPPEALVLGLIELSLIPLFVPEYVNQYVTMGVISTRINSWFSAVTVTAIGVVLRSHPGSLSPVNVPSVHVWLVARRQTQNVPEVFGWSLMNSRNVAFWISDPVVPEGITPRSKRTNAFVFGAATTMCAAAPLFALLPVNA
jgi:hypothetical protein